MPDRTHGLKVLLAAALAVLMVFTSLPALAQATEGWRVEGTVSLYLPDISGTTAFPLTGASGEVTLDAETILENLKMAFMGTLEVSRGDWGLFTDVLYMDIGDARSGFREISIGGLPLPAAANASADYDMKGWGWTLGGTWHALPGPAATLDVIAGARLFDIEQTLGWEITGDVGSIPLPGRAGTSTVGLSNWDGIVGAKGRLALGADRKWFAPYYLDVGTGDSELTWQAIGGAGYSFHWGDVVAAWRYLDCDMRSGIPVESLTFNGPSISTVFRW
jgi:hypothetical protein